MVCTGDETLDDMIARFDKSRATEAQLLELADMIRPYIGTSTKAFLVWIDLLLEVDKEKQDDEIDSD